MHFLLSLIPPRVGSASARFTINEHWAPQWFPGRTPTVLVVSYPTFIVACGKELSIRLKKGGLPRTGRYCFLSFLSSRANSESSSVIFSSRVSRYCCSNSFIRFAISCSRVIVIDFNKRALLQLPPMAVLEALVSFCSGFRPPLTRLLSSDGFLKSAHFYYSARTMSIGKGAIQKIFSVSER
jgi:hypothetical protein